MGLLSTKDSRNNNKMASDFHFPISNKALIIFTRNPELGKCKTRLAKAIGNEAALRIYKYLLQYTANFSEHIQADRYVYYSENIKKNDIWDDNIFRKKLQNGSDLGLRMQNAFTELLSRGYEKVIVIGSDLLDIKADNINHAFEQLDNNDVVIGPAQDGGYYLLGMKTLHSPVFINKNWGTATVLQDTLQDLKHITVHLLEELNDIDIYDDIKNIKELKQLIKK